MDSKLQFSWSQYSGCPCRRPFTFPPLFFDMGFKATNTTKYRVLCWTSILCVGAIVFHLKQPLIFQGFSSCIIDETDDSTLSEIPVEDLEVFEEEDDEETLLQSLQENWVVAVSVKLSSNANSVDPMVVSLCHRTKNVRRRSEKYLHIKD